MEPAVSRAQGARWPADRASLHALLVAAGLLVASPSIRAAEPGRPVEGLQVILTAHHKKLTVERPTLKLTVELRNVSGRPLSVYQHLSSVLGTPASVRFEVGAEDGSKIHIPQPIDDHPLPPADAYVPLKPGAALTQDITMDLGSGDGASSPLRAGRYTVSVEVILTEEGRLAGVTDAWAGTVVSNPVTIEVSSH